jgi:hypothetical protein
MCSCKFALTFFFSLLCQVTSSVYSQHLPRLPCSFDLRRLFSATRRYFFICGLTKSVWEVEFRVQMVKS